MSLFKCECCSFQSHFKSDYIRHLNTKKHINRVKDSSTEYVKNSTQFTQFTTSPPQLLHNFTPNLHNFTPNYAKKHKMSICEFCGKEFSRKDSLKRHLKNSCKMKKENDKINELNTIILRQQDENTKEKEKLYSYIDKLIDKTGNTNINIEKQMNNQTNTLNIKNFGEEDISHITNDFKLKMLSLPYGMIQNMIEKVHFNKKKPENKNIALTNKKDNMIKIFKGDKWKYQDRNIVVDQLIKKNYYRLDDFFEEGGKSKMNDIHSNRYKVFQNKFDKQDNDLLGRIKKETEMIILSENL